MPAEPFREDDGERGSAVVDFVLVSVLILTLLLAVLQVAVYVHLRNVVTASAQEGARFGANADVDSSRSTDPGCGFQISRYRLLQCGETTSLTGSNDFRLSTSRCMVPTTAKSFISIS